MTVKEKRTEAELISLLMAEARKHPECGHIDGVAITRPVQRTRQNPNWDCPWVVSGNGSALARAFEIGRRFQAQFDLA